MQPEAVCTNLPRAWSIDARTAVYYRDLILVLVGKEFKVRYKSTLLGYAWSLLHPLAFALILFVLFRVVMRFELEAYSLYLIAGLFPWQWISNTVASANFYFLGNGTLIKKVRFERAALVFAGVLNELVHFVVSMPVVIALMLYYGKRPTLDWLWLVPLLVTVQLAMTLGLALFIATSNLFFRDLERLSGILLNLTFYLTPIIFPIERVPQKFAPLLWLNPFVPIIGCWHGMFYDGSIRGAYLAAAAAWSLVILAGGAYVYSKCVWRFAEIV